jgi:hypothetical protein
VTTKNFGRFARKANKPCVMYIRNIEEKDRDAVRKLCFDERKTLSEFFTSLIRDHLKSRKKVRTKK